MHSKHRYVVVGIFALAIISAVAMSHGFEWVWVRFGWPNPHLAGGELALTTILAYALGLGAAAYCFIHKPTYQLALEVVDELSKVTWPSREETGNATVVVIVTVAVCSAYLGVFDAVWLWVTDWILGVDTALTSG